MTRKGPPPAEHSSREAEPEWAADADPGTSHAGYRRPAIVWEQPFVALAYTSCVPGQGDCPGVRQDDPGEES
jgi:hypothetical protein